VWVQLKGYGRTSKYLLRFQYIVLADPAALKEAVARHVLAKQKNDHYQDD
jgi:hypothetical protein